MTKIDVSGFIRENMIPYSGGSEFLETPTAKTLKLWNIIRDLKEKEREKGGVLDVDASKPAGMLSFPAAFIDDLDNVIVGLQTDKPLKRDVHPQGGINMVNAALKAYGYDEDPKMTELYSNTIKTHNQGVFDIYTKEMRAARKSGILTGLPDAYGRGRIIGDYRRVALYGIDALVEEKNRDLDNISGDMTESKMRLRGEVNDQIRALQDMKTMGGMYGFDVGRPATNAKEAIQWLYFGYLAAVKDNDGAAMSLGRVDAFLDIYIQRDLDNGVLSEKDAQELIDNFVIKLRIVNQLRTPAYNELFSGDPTWVTAVLGGMTNEIDGSPASHMVTKTSFRILQTLYNLGPSPEPNITILWDDNLPTSFKNFCSKVSIDTSSIQYESDKLMNPIFGDDYAIACCVSAMKVGKDMQFFGARCNLPKLLLYALNQGRDELSGAQVGPRFSSIKDTSGPLVYEEVVDLFDKALDWLVGLYINTMNAIHYSHDRNFYESSMMALHDTEVRRFLALGVAGLSVIADSLSAIKYAEVTPRYDENGLMVDFDIEGDFPKYGNNDDRVDSIAVELTEKFMDRAKQCETYRDAIPTLSVLTITSNVIYGKKTGSTPDGRKKGVPYAPGANPMHGRDKSGALASLQSVSKLPYKHCLDGISNTFSIIPNTLGTMDTDRVANLSSMLDGYFNSKGFHLNVNVLDREMLMDAIENPSEYPNLTIRVSGYAVLFHKLTREQQLDVISRTFHETM